MNPTLATMISFYRIKHWYPEVWLKPKYWIPIQMSKEHIEYDEIDSLTLPAAPSVTGVTP